MAREFHAATFIISRTCLFKDLLKQKKVRDWFGKAVDDVGYDDEYGYDEYEKDSQELSETNYFIDNLGPVYEYPPGKMLVDEPYHFSNLLDEPFYIPANWRIKYRDIQEGEGFTVRLRIRLYQHGICTLALYCQMTRKDEGWPAEQFVKLLRGMVDDKAPDPPIFKVTTSRETFEETSIGILNRALFAVAAGVFEPSHREMAMKNISRLEPDHLLLDLGKTSPQLRLPDDDEEIAHLLALNTDPDRVITHFRQQDLGLYKTDWIGANSKHFLFCDTREPWPARTRPEGHLRDKGARRALMRRGRIVWRMFAIIEIIRSHKLLAREISKEFQQANLAMTQAKNRNISFLRNMFKSTFYDDRPFALALDIPVIHAKLYGRSGKLYKFLSATMGLDNTESRMKAEAEKFESQVNSWKPGITRFIDIFKVIAG